MTDPYEDLPEALYAQWERRWGSVAFLGVMIMSVIVGVGAIVMYEATSTAPYALGITGALCGILAGVSMLTVAACARERQTYPTWSAAAEHSLSRQRGSGLRRAGCGWQCSASDCCSSASA